MRSKCVPPALSIAAAVATVFIMTIATRAEPTTPAALKWAVQKAKFTLVGTVTDTQASQRRSQWGDEIIVTRAVLRTDEVLKGAPPSWVPLDVDGGTIDGITMEASHTPLLRRGERAVFLVDQLADGRFIAHERGAGILKLRPDDHVADSALTLNDIRALAREAQ
jgi:hypothetical protein